jgi:hypothetical protein
MSSKFMGIVVSQKRTEKLLTGSERDKQGQARVYTKWSPDTKWS